MGKIEINFENLKIYFHFKAATTSDAYADYIGAPAWKACANEGVFAKWAATDPVKNAVKNPAIKTAIDQLYKAVPG